MAFLLYYLDLLIAKIPRSISRGSLFAQFQGNLLLQEVAMKQLLLCLSCCMPGKLSLVHPLLQLRSSTETFWLLRSDARLWQVIL